jgi:hypothetical protein
VRCQAKRVRRAVRPVPLTHLLQLANPSAVAEGLAAFLAEVADGT